MYNSDSMECLHKLRGHSDEISRVCSILIQICFNSQGTLLLTASQDKTVKLWDTKSGKCLQTLETHTDEVFSALFNYDGDALITASKDNTISIWKQIENVE